MLTRLMSLDLLVTGLAYCESVRALRLPSSKANLAQMKRVFSIIAALYDLLAERRETEINALPRNVERIITYGLEIPIKRMFPLTIREAFRYLCILCGKDETPLIPMADRKLYGLLH